LLFFVQCIYTIHSFGSNGSVVPVKDAWLSYIVFALSMLPYAISATLSERFFDEGADMNRQHHLCKKTHFAGGGVIFFETATVFLSIICQLLLSYAQGPCLAWVGQKSEPFSFKAGFQCMFGESEACGFGIWPAFSFLLATCLSLSNDFSELLLIRYGNAALQTACQGFASPTVAVFMSFRFMGQFREPFSVLNLLGALLCVAGMVMWARGEQLRQLKEREGEKV
jgi:hypothetical protein